MKYLAAIFVCLTLMLTSAQAQSEKDTIPNSNAKLNHSLGAVAGKANGLGLTYRYWPGDFGVQATFGPYLEDDLVNYSAGITLMYKIAGAELVELFAYQGNHFQHSEYNDTVWIPEEQTYRDEIKKEEHFYTGIGLGVEFIILKQINLDLMLGYTAVENFSGVTITGGVGLYYNF